MLKVKLDRVGWELWSEGGQRNSSTYESISDVSEDCSLALLHDIVWRGIVDRFDVAAAVLLVPNLGSVQVVVTFDALEGVKESLVDMEGEQLVVPSR